MWKEILCIFIVLGLSFSAPQEKKDGEKEKDTPYEYKYEVNDAESKNYYGHEENKKDTGRTEGKYFVWLADGRLMTVTYYVDGESGFVPTITFSEPGYQPPASGSAS